MANFCMGVIPPMAMLGRLLLLVHSHRAADNWEQAGGRQAQPGAWRGGSVVRAHDAACDQCRDDGACGLLG